MANIPTLDLSVFSGEYSQEIITSVLNELDCAKDCTLLTGIPFKLTMPKLKAVAGVRPYRTQADFITSAEFTDRTLEVFDSKKDLAIEPIKYRTTYLQKVDKGEYNPDNFLFEDLVMTEELRSYLAEINNDTAYLGVRDDAGNAAVDVANGWGTIIADAITAGDLVPITVGSITDANAIAKFEGMYKSLPAAWRKVETKLYCSFENYDHYVESIPANKNVMVINSGNPDNETKYFLPTSRRKCEIVPATWMGTSDRLIITQKDNLVMGVAYSDSQPSIKMLPTLYGYEARILFFPGFQIADLEALFVSEAA